MSGLDIGTLRGSIVIDDLGSSNLMAFDRTAVKTEQNFNKSIGTGVSKGSDKARDATGRFVKDANTGLVGVTKNTTQAGLVFDKSIGTTVPKSAGKARDEVGRFVKDADKGLSGVSKTSTSAGNSLATLASKARTASSSLTSNGTALSIGLTAPVTLLGGAAILSASKFEKSMNIVNAVIQPTAGEMKELEAAAMKMGAETVFSAAQAADAMGELGKAGFTAQQSIEALPSVLQLAAATNIGLADAATLTANTMKTFGLEVSDLSRVNDIFAKGANAATLDVTDLRESIKYVGPVAKTVGYDLGDTVAVMGLLSEAGIKGSMAGTALRGILTELLNPGKNLTEVMKDLGIKSFETNGKVMEMSDVLDILKARGVSSAQVMEAFGDRAGPSLLALLDKGGGALRNFNGLLDDSAGTAKRASDAMMDGLPGVLEEISGSTETASIALGRLLKPAITTAGAAIGWMASLVIEDLVPGIQALPPGVKTSIVVLGSLALAAGPVMIGLGGVARLFGLAAEGAAFFASSRAGVAMASTLAAISNSVPVLTARLWMLDASTKAVTLSTTAMTSAKVFWGSTLFTLGNTIPVLTARIWLMEASTAASAMASKGAAAAKGLLTGALATTGLTANVFTARIGASSIATTALSVAARVGSVAVSGLSVAFGTLAIAVPYIALFSGLAFGVHQVAGAFKGLAAAIREGNVWEFLTAKDDDNWLRRWLGLSRGIDETSRSAAGFGKDIRLVDDRFEQLAGRISGAKVEEDLGRLNQVFLSLSRTGPLAADAKKRLAMDAINLRNEGAKLTPELAAIVGWFEKLDPAARSLGNGLAGAGDKTDRFTESLKSLRESQQGLVIDAKAMVAHLLGKGGVAGVSSLTTSQTDALHGALQAVIDEYGSLQRAGLGAMQGIYDRTDAIVGKTAELRKQLAGLSSSEITRLQLLTSGGGGMFGSAAALAAAALLPKDGGRSLTDIAAQRESNQGMLDAGGNMGGPFGQAAGFAARLAAIGSLFGFARRPSQEQIDRDYAMVNAGGNMGGFAGMALSGAALVNRTAGTFGMPKPTMGTRFGDFMGSMPGTILGAFQGGGSVSGAIGSSLAGFGAKELVGSFSKTFAASGLGKLASGALGSFLPVVGGLVAPMITGLFGKLFGGGEKKEAQGLANQFIEQAGGLANLTKMAKEAGVSIDGLLSAKKKNVAQAEIAKITKALEKAKEEQERLTAAVERYGLTWRHMDAAHQLKEISRQATELIADHDLLIAKGYAVDAVNKQMAGSTNEWLNNALTAGARIPPAMQPMIESLIRSGQLTEENARLLMGLGAAGGPSLDAVREAADYLGVSIESLGPKVNQLRITEEATKAAQAWNTLVDAGADMGVVMGVAKDKAQEFVTHALTAGIELPASMKPMLESMVEHGLLVDASGEKLKDLSGINFATPLKDMFEDLIGKLNEFIDRLGGGVADATREARDQAARNPIVIKGRFDMERGRFIRDQNDGLSWDWDSAHTGGLVTAAGIQKHHGGTGRVLPGPWGQEVPALLLAGEAVLNPAATAAIGPSTIESWNKNPEAIGDFARGAEASVKGDMSAPGGAGGSEATVSAVGALGGQLAAINRRLAKQDRAIARAVVSAMNRRSA